MSEADRAAVRDNLLQGIVRAPPAVRSQLGECAKYVVHTDYPQRWPALLPSIVAHLGTQVSIGQPCGSSVKCVMNSDHVRWPKKCPISEQQLSKDQQRHAAV